MASLSPSVARPGSPQILSLGSVALQSDKYCAHSKRVEGLDDGAGEKRHSLVSGQYVTIPEKGLRSGMDRVVMRLADL